MKRFALLLLLLAIAGPVWSAGPRKLTVAELTDLLASQQAAKKSDADVARQLTQVQLTEELNSNTREALTKYLPGVLSTEQLYVLEALSSMLPPPAAELPTAPPPNPAAQQAMLAKAQDYVARTYSQLPPLAAARMTARFQDGVVTPPTYSTIQGVGDNVDPIFEQAKVAVRLMNTKTDTVDSEHGIEKQAKDKTPWGPNGQATSVGPALTLSAAMPEIAANGNPKFLRWQTILGHQIAVFSFAVDKKKTHFSVVYCCFPDTDTTGTTHISSAITAGGNLPGNMQNNVEWRNFKSSTGYHGELYLDSESVVVVRLITEAEFKPSEFVHYEDIRTDFAPVAVAGKTLIVPIRSFTLAEIVPNGDAKSAHVTIRHQIVTQDLKDYQIPGATTAQK